MGGVDVNKGMKEKEIQVETTRDVQEVDEVSEDDM